MRAMREHLVQADKRYYQYQKESWFLDAVEIYCDAINCLAHDLTAADLKSRGFVACRQYLVNYAASESFTLLLVETQRLKVDLSTVKYCLLIKDNRFKLRKYESETDYSAEVEETFHKFKQGAVKDYSVKFSDWPDMNHVEAKALDFVAQLYPDIFASLANYRVKNANYLDETIARFDREITGANQGGKSTFLRSIGLAELMMQCGMFVPAQSFCANVCNGLFTHYKREEDVTMKSGKLDEELNRMSDIADQITPNSMLLFSESFAATNEREGSEIARQIVCALLEKRIKVFFVTHLYEFAHGFYDKKMQDAFFLRAERQPDGARTFKLVEGEPLQTSYGEDLYNKIFNSIAGNDGVESLPVSAHTVLNR
jgi:hypothetical protein